MQPHNREDIRRGRAAGGGYEAALKACDSAAEGVQGGGRRVRAEGTARKMVLHGQEAKGVRAPQGKGNWLLG